MNFMMLYGCFSMAHNLEIGATNNKTKEGSGGIGRRSKAL